MSDRSEHAAVLALVNASSTLWHRTASIIECVGSALRIVDGDFSGFEASATRADGEELASAVRTEDLDSYVQLIAAMADEGVKLITVLDDEYPLNLRQVFNRPPFLWVKGTLLRQDDRSVAIVGTRKASKAGLDQARRLSRELASRGATVLSGLARGIDTAAHSAALEKHGRTVAVMGTGIRNIYPKENRALAEEIVQSGGALISQFWPDSPPTKVSFPMRNVVMSGLGVGTVVIEANSVSGAKMQARLALEHGKRVFLLESLVAQEEWAKKYAQHPGASIVKSVDDIYDVLVDMTTPAEQLTLY